MSEPDDDELFKVPTAEDRYPREARRAAEQYLSARRTVCWMFPVAIALITASNLTAGVLSLVVWGFAVVGLTQAGVAMGKLVTSMQWIGSLRAILDYSPVPRGVGVGRWAKATLAGERVPSDLEMALNTIWSGEGDLEETRRVLTRRGLPDVSGDDYEPKPDSPMPVWQRHGVRWQEAPLPDIEHACTGWSVALFHGGTEKAEVVMFCACGGVTYPTGANMWGMRNQRRREEPAQP